MDYISELKSPSLEAELSPIVIQSYLSNLERLRQIFIAALSDAPDASRRAYLEELKQTRTEILKRGFADLDIRTSTDMVLGGFEKVGYTLMLNSQLDRGLIKSLDKTTEFINNLLGGGGVVTSTEPKEQPKEKKGAVKKEEQPSVFYKTLSEYGAFLKVKDLTEIFKCDRKTIYNWDKKEGFLVNVSETSEEINSVGRKKRKKEKMYRKEDILKSLELQAKFNERR